MPVSLPTAADVRKARRQAARNAAGRAEAARTPILAVLGAGDYAVTTVTTGVTKAVTDARARATERAEEAQTLARTLPRRLTPDELRKTAAELRDQAEVRYEGLAERGEQAWGRLREQPQVRQAIATIESYTEQLDARMDTFVDDAHDAAEKALATVTRQTRSTGEKVARRTQQVAGEAAGTVTEVSRNASAKVAEAGAEVAADIAEIGDEAAHETRSASRKAANRTEPKTAPPAARKPAPRRSTDTTAK